MVDINSLIALGGGGLQQFDLAKLGTQALDMEGKRISNDTAGFNLQQGYERKDALSNYDKAQRAGDPQALSVLNTQPHEMGQIVQARAAMDTGERAKFDWVMGHRARAANAVAQFPAGSPQRLEAWNEQLDELLKNQAISPDQYKSLHSKEPSDLLLQQYIAAGMQVPAYMEYGVKKAGIGAAERFGAAVNAGMGGGQSAAGAPAAAPAAPAPGGASPNEVRLIKSESRGNPRLVNEYGYAGTYQFGAPRLADLGVYTPGPGENMKSWSRTYKSAPGKWSGEFNVPGFPQVKTIQDFLANPDAQKAAYGAHRVEMNREIDRNGFDKYIGTKVGGVLITRDGLENMLHLGGVGSTKRALESDGKDDPTDANKKSVLDYARMAPQGSEQAAAPLRGAGAGAPDQIKALVPAAMAAIATPGVPENVAKGAQQIIDWAKQDTKPTEMGKNYDDYASQERTEGRVPMSRLDYEIKIKSAGATNVSVDTKGATAEEQEKGKDVAQRLGKMAKEGDDAVPQRAVVGRLGSMLERSGTGADIAFANWTREHFGEQIGGVFATKKRLESAEAATALINYMKPRMRVAGSGSSSDIDMDAFAKAIPSLLSTQGGRRLVVETLGGMQQALIDRGDIATRYQTSDLSAKQAFEQIRKLPDPFSSFREYQKAQQGNAGAITETLQHFKTPEEVAKAVEQNKLQPGDMFIIDDGQGGVGTVPGKPKPAKAAAN